jgi:hypothetical protein
MRVEVVNVKTGPTVTQYAVSPITEVERKRCAALERKVGAGCKDGGSGFVRDSGAGAEKIGRNGFTV